MARIKKFVNLYKEFDADDDELTRTRKLRRAFVEEALQRHCRRALFRCRCRPHGHDHHLRGRKSRSNQNGPSGDGSPSIKLGIWGKGSRGCVKKIEFLEPLNPRILDAFCWEVSWTLLTALHHRDSCWKHLRPRGPGLDPDLQMLRGPQPGHG